MICLTVRLKPMASMLVIIKVKADILAITVMISDIQFSVLTALALNQESGTGADSLPAPGTFLIHSTNSISPGRQVLSIQACSGPYMRRMMNQLLPGMVSSQLSSLPSGALGPK